MQTESQSYKNKGFNLNYAPDLNKNNIFARKLIREIP